MKKLSLIERARCYARAFPSWPAPRADERWLDGIWVLGNNYRGSGLYGAYPPNYVARVLSMFPDAERLLHLFSGSLPREIGTTYFDLQDGDAHQLSDYYQPNSFDLILADPPYSIEDAAHYGAPMINRNKVVKECAKVIESGGFLVWLDQVLPMFSNSDWHLCGLIGIVRSTNHRFRIASLFRRESQITTAQT